MGKYVNLAEAIDFFKGVDATMTGTWVADTLESFSTIDIVHCKECKRKYVTGNTTQYYVCDFMDAQFDENGYCHHGGRRDNE